MKFLDENINTKTIETKLKTNQKITNQLNFLLKFMDQVVSKVHDRIISPNLQSHNAKGKT